MPYAAAVGRIAAVRGLQHMDGSILEALVRGSPIQDVLILGAFVPLVSRIPAPSAVVVSLPGGVARAKTI